MACLEQTMAPSFKWTIDCGVVCRVMVVVLAGLDWTGLVWTGLDWTGLVS